MPANCANCGISFSVEAEEVEWLKEQEKDLPILCPRCRAFKTGLQDESITCQVCGRVFIHPRELRLFARMFSWPRPRRCLGGCRREAPPLNEQEQLMADFLRRLRSARRNRSASRLTVRETPGLPSARNRSGPSRSSRSPEPGPDELGGSLAQALKEFRERKRRGS